MVSVATFTTSFSSTGNQTIKAVYGGDRTSTAAPRLAQPKPFVPPHHDDHCCHVESFLLWPTITFTATVSASAQRGWAGAGAAARVGGQQYREPTGTVTFQYGSLTLGRCHSQRRDKLLFRLVAVGGQVSTTSQLSTAATANVAGSTSSAWTQTINQATTTLSLSSSTSPSAFGQNVIFTATVSPSGWGLATGRVIFQDGNSFLGVARLGGNDVASFTTCPDGGQPTRSRRSTPATAISPAVLRL